jgi:dolichol-phosphate hexosyltransferase
MTRLPRDVRYSIVVPARNEEATLAEVLEGLRGLTDDLLVVDGHSSDKTVVLAKDYGARVVSDNGRGKGDAIRVALARVHHPITVFIDADGSHDPGDIQKLVGPSPQTRRTWLSALGCLAVVTSCSGPFLRSRG